MFDRQRQDLVMTTMSEIVLVVCLVREQERISCFKIFWYLIKITPKIYPFPEVHEN